MDKVRDTGILWWKGWGRYFSFRKFRLKHVQLLK